MLAKWPIICDRLASDLTALLLVLFTTFALVGCFRATEPAKTIVVVNASDIEKLANESWLEVTFRETPKDLVLEGLKHCVTTSTIRFDGCIIDTEVVEKYNFCAKGAHNLSVLGSIAPEPHAVSLLLDSRKYNMFNIEVTEWTPELSEAFQNARADSVTVICKNGMDGPAIRRLTLVKGLRVLFLGLGDQNWPAEAVEKESRATGVQVRRLNVRE